MVTTVSSTLCFWISSLLQKEMDSVGILLLALIAIGIHTFLLVSQCSFSASSSDSFPDSLLSFFISAARSSSVLLSLPFCFPEGSNPHRPLLAPHNSTSVPACPRLHAPPALLLLLNPERCLWRKTLEMPWKMPPCLQSQRQILGPVKATFVRARQISWPTTCPGHTPGVWQSREGTQSRLPSPAPPLQPLGRVFVWFGLVYPSGDAAEFWRCPQRPLLVPAAPGSRCERVQPWPCSFSGYFRFRRWNTEKITVVPGPVPGGMQD